MNTISAEDTNAILEALGLPADEWNQVVSEARADADADGIDLSEYDDDTLRTLALVETVFLFTCGNLAEASGMDPEEVFDLMFAGKSMALNYEVEDGVCVFLELKPGATKQQGDL